MKIKQKQQPGPAEDKKTQPHRHQNNHRPRPSKQSKQGKLNLPQPDPVLRFSPTAWSKLLFFRDRGETEIGGFGVTSADDLLRVEEFVAVKQQDTVASISFDDEAVADYFEMQVDAGRKPQEFARIWLHTHPGDSPQPSGTDEETFQRVFGHCEWAVMFILARSGKAYAGLRFNVGPGGSLQIPVDVTYAFPFGPSDHDLWEAEYRTNIKSVDWLPFGGQRSVMSDQLTLYQGPVPDVLEELEGMDPAERELFMQELAGRPDLWDEESEVMW